MIAIVQITPVTTTASDINVVLTDRKKNNRIKTLNAREPKRNNFISACILSATTVLISGNPLKWVCILVALEKESTVLVILFITSVLSFEFRISLLIRTPIR